jgi:hypothetical protein
MVLNISQRNVSNYARQNYASQAQPGYAVGDLFGFGMT